MLNDHQYKIKGIVALPLVIALVVLIVSLGIAISALGFNEVTNSLRLSDSDKALLYAESGARDALQRMIFNKNYENTSGYTIPFATSDGCTSGIWNGCATVKVYSKIGGTVLSPTVISTEGRYKNSVRLLNVGAITSPDGSGIILTVVRNEVKNLPVPFTAQATGVTWNAATLNGWVNPNGNTTTAWFRYDDTPVPTVCDNAFGTKKPDVDISAGSGTDPVSFTTNITGLTAEKKYYFCAIVDETSSSEQFGRLYNFTTIAYAQSAYYAQSSYYTQASYIYSVGAIDPPTATDIALSNSPSQFGLFEAPKQILMDFISSISQNLIAD